MSRFGFTQRSDYENVITLFSVLIFYTQSCVRLWF